MSTKSSRQLAAIMFTDIVGYTAMMQSDELAGLSKGKRYRKELDRLVKIHEGEVLKHLGDGSLTIFSSAVNAVRCAQNLQLSLKAKSDSKGEVEEIPLRIGLHLGDIVFEEDDIYGNGVNIASRVESLGQAGTVLFSQSIQEQIQCLPEFQMISMGSFHFKNVEEPMEIFALSNEQMVVPTPESITGKLKAPGIDKSKLIIGRKWAIAISTFIVLFIALSLSWNLIFGKYFSDKQQMLESIKSIAVLPFVNYMEEDNQNFWVLGLHDDLIYEMGQLGALRVISQTSMLPYANSQKSIQEIAAELKVDALLETSVRNVGDSIILKLKLINAFPEEQQLWSQSFDVLKSDILNLYSEITRNIANKINLVLSPQEELLLAESKAVDPDVYEAYLRGKFNMGYLTMEGQETAIEYFEKAIELDSDFAPAHAALGGVWAFMKQMGFISTDKASPKIELHLSNALALDSTIADVYYWLAIKEVWTDYDWKKGEYAFKRSIELQPNFSEAHALFAHYLLCLNRFDEAREQMNIALEIDPNNPFVQVLNGIVNLHEGNVENSIKIFEKLELIMPNNPLVNLGLTMGYFTTNQYDKTILKIKEWILMFSDEQIAKVLEEEFEKSDFKTALNIASDLLAQSTNSNFISAGQLYLYYALAENWEKALYWVERGYIRKEPETPYIAIYKFLKPLHKEPRFLEIIRTMGLDLKTE